MAAWQTFSRGVDLLAEEVCVDAVRCLLDGGVWVVR
jgi:hypothetical protein